MIDYGRLHESILKAGAITSATAAIFLGGMATEALTQEQNASKTSQTTEASAYNESAQKYGLIAFGELLIAGVLSAKVLKPKEKIQTP